MFDKKLLKNFDYLIPLLIFFLTSFGALAIGVAMRLPIEGTEEGIIEAIGNFNFKYVELHMIFFLTGIVLMLITVSFHYHVYKDLAGYLYWASIALLVLVAFKGHTAGNAQRWLDFGPLKLQPSDFGKLSIIIIMAKLLSKDEKEGEKGSYSLKDMIVMVFYIALPLALIMKQPDVGTALVYIVIIFSMLFAAGISYKLLFGIIGAGIASIPVFWYTILSEVQKKRILVFLNPGLDPMNEGYNVLQSITAIGSGQIYGKGILSDNTLSQLNFLPAKYTDFIFSVSAEALGFIGGITVIALYWFLIMRTIGIATKAKDNFGSLIVVGVTSMMMFHIFENIGMTMGLMPVTGITLPFVSYGGSSMWTNMIAFGLVLNVGMRRQKIKF